MRACHHVTGAKCESRPWEWMIWKWKCVPSNNDQMWNTRIKAVTASGTQGAHSLQLLDSFQQRGRSRLQIHLMGTTDELVFIMWFLKHSNSIFFFRSVCTMFKWLTRKLSSRYCKIFLLLCYWPWCFPNLLLSFAVVSFTKSSYRQTKTVSRISSLDLQY